MMSLDPGQRSFTMIRGGRCAMDLFSVRVRCVVSWLRCAAPAPVPCSALGLLTKDIKGQIDIAHCLYLESSPAM